MNLCQKLWAAGEKIFIPLELTGVNFQVELCSQELTFDFEDYRGGYLLPETLYLNSESLRKIL